MTSFSNRFDSVMNVEEPKSLIKYTRKKSRGKVVNAEGQDKSGITQ